MAMRGEAAITASRDAVATAGAAVPGTGGGVPAPDGPAPGVAPGCAAFGCVAPGWVCDLLLLLEQRLLALLLHLRIADEILPADHDDQRQHDGNDGVLVLAHSMLMHYAVFGAVGAVVLPVRGEPGCM